jgi:hypothetical protein
MRTHRSSLQDAAGKAYPLAQEWSRVARVDNFFGIEAFSRAEGAAQPFHPSFDFCQAGGWVWMGFQLPPERCFYPAIHRQAAPVT